MAPPAGVERTFNRVRPAPTWLLVIAGLFACTRLLSNDYEPPDPTELLKLPSAEWMPWWVRALAPMWHPLVFAVRHTVMLVLPAIAILTWEKFAEWCYHVLFDPAYNGRLDMLLQGRYFRAAAAAVSFACSKTFATVLAAVCFAVPAGTMTLPVVWMPYSLLLYSSVPFTRFAKCDVATASAALRTAEYFGSEVFNASLLQHATEFSRANFSLPSSPAWNVLSVFPAPDMFSIDTAISNLAQEKVSGLAQVTTAENHIWFTYMQTAVLFGVFIACELKESLREILSHTTVLEEDFVRLRHSQAQKLRGTFAKVIRIGTSILTAAAVFSSVWHIIEHIRLCIVVVTQLPCHHPAFPLMACVTVLLTASFVVANIQFILMIASGVHRCRLSDGVTSRHMEKIGQACERVELLQLQDMNLCQKLPDSREARERKRKDICARIELGDITPWLETYANECERRLRNSPIDEIVASVSAPTSAMRWLFWSCSVSQAVIMLLGCVSYVYCVFCVWFMSVSGIPLGWMENNPEWSMYVVAATFRRQFSSLQQFAPPSPVTWDVQQQFRDLTKGAQHVLSCMNEMSPSVALNLLDGFRAGPPISWRQYFAGLFLAGLLSAGTWILCFFVIVMIIAGVYAVSLEPLADVRKLSSSNVTKLLSPATEEDDSGPVQKWLRFCLDIRKTSHGRMPDAVCANLDFVSLGAILLHLIDNNHTFTEESCNSMVEELTNGYREILPSSATALLWLLQKRGLGALRTKEAWNGLTPRMMFTALPASATYCRPNLQRSLPIIPRVVKCTPVADMPLRVNGQHLWHMYGDEEDPTPWALHMQEWLGQFDEDDDERSLAFCLMPLATYLQSVDGHDDEDDEDDQGAEEKEEEGPKQKDITLMHDLLRSGLERRLLCGRDDAAMAALTAESNAFYEHNDNLRELEDDAAARKELRRREACSHNAYDLTYTFSTWWRDAKQMNGRLRLACLTTHLEVAHRDARWHARKAAVYAWAYGSAHSPDDFPADSIFSVR